MRGGSHLTHLISPITVFKIKFFFHFKQTVEAHDPRLEERVRSPFEPPSSSERLVRSARRSEGCRESTGRRPFQTRSFSLRNRPRRLVDREVDFASSLWPTLADASFRKRFRRVSDPANGFSLFFGGEVRSEAVTTSIFEVVTALV